MDLFTSSGSLLGKRKTKELDSPKGWHNIFYEEVTSRIDETPFFVLYSDKGRPNAPIRQMLAMMILKEGNGWTDAQLYHNSRFNLMTMRCLGLINGSDEPPVESTYYAFKRKLLEHWTKTGEDLAHACFQQVTSDQVLSYGVSGERTRMDSKMISSNIKTCSRLQLIITVLRYYYKSKKKIGYDHLVYSDYEMLKKLSSGTVSKLTFDLTTEEKDQLMVEMIELLVRIKQSDRGKDEGIELVRQLISEQLSIDINTNEVELKSTKEIKGATLQSPHDPEATYRKKQDKAVTGYSGNITETCDEGELRLIVGVQVETVTHSDERFFQPAIEEANKVVKNQIKTVITDGGYPSESGRKFVKEEEIEWHVTGKRGRTRRYLLDREGEDLMVTDTETGIIYKAEKITNRKGEIKYKIPNTKYRGRYFTEKQIEGYERSLRMLNIPQYVNNLRANVESTIHQVFCKLNGNKSKYRGLFQHKCLAIGMCFWANYRRIANLIQGKGQWKAIFIYFLAVIVHKAPHGEAKMYHVKQIFNSN